MSKELVTGGNDTSRPLTVTRSKSLTSYSKQDCEVLLQKALDFNTFLKEGRSINTDPLKLKLIYPTIRNSQAAMFNVVGAGGLLQAFEAATKTGLYSLFANWLRFAKGTYASLEEDARELATMAYDPHGQCARKLSAAEVLKCYNMFVAKQGPFGPRVYIRPEYFTIASILDCISLYIEYLTQLSAKAEQDAYREAENQRAEALRLKREAMTIEEMAAEQQRWDELEQRLNSMIKDAENQEQVKPQPKRNLKTELLGVVRKWAYLTYLKDKKAETEEHAPISELQKQRKKVAESLLGKKDLNEDEAIELLVVSKLADLRKAEEEFCKAKMVEPENKATLNERFKEVFQVAVQSRGEHFAKKFRKPTKEELQANTPLAKLYLSIKQEATSLVDYEFGLKFSENFMLEQIQMLGLEIQQMQ